MHKRKCNFWLRNEPLINNHAKAYFGDLWTHSCFPSAKNWSLPKCPLRRYIRFPGIDPPKNEIIFHSLKIILKKEKNGKKLLKRLFAKKFWKASTFWKYNIFLYLFPQCASLTLSMYLLSRLEWHQSRMHLNDPMTMIRVTIMDWNLRGQLVWST